MLIRLLGKEKEALGNKAAHPFTDVTDWASNYIGYLYQNGLSNGIENSKYGNGAMNAKSYVTLVIRALGYNDKNGDFNWENVFREIYI